MSHSNPAGFYAVELLVVSLSLGFRCMLLTPCGLPSRRLAACRAGQPEAIGLAMPTITHPSHVPIGSRSFGRANGRHRERTPGGGARGLAIGLRPRHMPDGVAEHARTAALESCGCMMHSTFRLRRPATLAASRRLVRLPVPIGQCTELKPISHPKRPWRPQYVGKQMEVIAFAPDGRCAR